MPDTPFQPVGHLIAASDGSIEGAQGIGYDYIMAAGGLYVQSQSDDIVARINIARRNIRGLGAIEEKIQLTDGPIPGHMIALGLRWFRTNPDTERFFAIRRGTEGYELIIPEQEGQALSLTYTPEPRAIAEFHSHSRARALFSTTDNADEQGFKIYGVLGRAPPIRSRTQPETRHLRKLRAAHLVRRVLRPNAERNDDRPDRTGRQKPALRKRQRENIA